MKIQRVHDNHEVEDDIRYQITLTPLQAGTDEYASRDHDAHIVLSGKELKRIVELVNTFNKLQDNPAPLSGLGDMVKLLQSFGAK